MKIRTLVCSTNHYFVDCFSIYVMGKECLEFEFSFFTDKEAAWKWVNEQIVDLILADEMILQEWQLSGGYTQVCISNRTMIQTDAAWHELNIYQRGVDIFSDIQKIAQAIHGGSILGQKERKIITFYSPQGGTGKTTLAYICAMLYSKNENGIYLNLEEFGYTEHLYQVPFEYGMEDIMFDIKDKRDVLISITNAMKKDKHNVSVLPQMKNYSDLADLNVEDLQVLLEGIQHTSSKNCVFVDLSGGLTDENRKIMDMSDINFWVFEEGAVGKGKMERIKADRSVHGASFFSRSYFLINKCKDKSEDVDAIHIPFSQSLSAGSDVETVLSGNRDFYQKCMDIVGMINK